MLQGNVIVNRRKISYLCYQIRTFGAGEAAFREGETYVVLGLAIHGACGILAVGY